MKERELPPLEAVVTVRIDALVRLVAALTTVLIWCVVAIAFLLVQPSLELFAQVWPLTGLTGLGVAYGSFRLAEFCCYQWMRHYEANHLQR